jgi:hypothetical protein
MSEKLSTGLDRKEVKDNHRYVINPYMQLKLLEIEMLLDGEHANLQVQNWAMNKYGPERVLKLIHEYINQIKKIIA